MPKGILSTEFIDIGDLDCKSLEPKNISFQIINIGTMSIAYKIHWISSPSCSIKFDNKTGTIPPLSDIIESDN